MSPLPHRVRRLSFQVRATSSGEALALRTALHAQIDTVTAAMMRALDAAGAGDAIVRLRRLEVRARIASVDEVGDALAQRIEHALREQLGALRIGASLDAAAPPPAIGGTADPCERRVGSAGQAAQPDGAGGAERERIAEPWRGGPDRASGGEPESLPARLALLVHYLEAGALPWPLAHLSTAAALSELRDAAAAEPARIVDQLVREPAGFRAQHALWFRWLQLVPEATWPIVARAAVASGEAGARLSEIVAALSGAAAAWLPRHARLQLAAAAIVLARQTIPITGSAELAAVVYAALGAAAAVRTAGGAPKDRAVPGGAPDRASYSASGTWVSGEAGADPGPAAVLASRLPEPAATAFRHWLASPRRLDPDAVAPGGARSAAALPDAAQHAAPSATGPVARDAMAAAALPDAAQHAALRGGVEPAPAAPRTADPGAASGATLRAMPFGQMVHHAGLVLLHPYLPRFFEGTAVKQAGTPALTEAELPRAAALLHLVATGDPEPYELEIDVIKLLLGVPLDAPLPISGGLVSASDREEVDALLAAVIEHWGALRRTSVQGLRVSFLQRHGLLREDEQGFRLQVEPAPFDMLLGQLPWGIAVVKLPWMTTALFTDWPAP